MTKHVSQVQDRSVCSRALKAFGAASRLVACVGLAVLSALPLHARDAYVPYVESLAAAQKRAYFKAAPSGQDEPLATSSETLVLAPEPIMEESRLEQEAEEKSGPLSLEQTQQDQVLSEDLEQFGYDIFNRIPSTYAPVEGIPVPPNYRVGPGDTMIVQLFGKRNVEYKLVVTRDGNILVPEYGPVAVAGLSFDEARQLIREGFERRVIGAKAVVTIGQLRTIQVRLAGDVVQPGIYTVGGLTTLIDAVLTTGGIRPSGSLRNIELFRAGKRVARLDLYELLLQGHSKGDVGLNNNDTIFVHAIGPVVYVGGEVQRPAIYELKGEQTLSQILDMAGGLLPTASLPHSHIERILDNGTRTLLDLSTSRRDQSTDEILRSRIKNGDFLRILPLEDELEEVVMLSGHVKRPGAYQFHDGMRVSDLLRNVDSLLPGADVDFALIKREQAGTLRTEIVYVNLLEALRQPGSSADTILQARDELVAFNLARDRAQALTQIVQELDVQATDYRPARLVEMHGALRFTGRLPLQESARLLDVVALAGGMLPGSELYYGVIARTQFPGRDIDTLPFSLAAALSDPASAANIAIVPGDRVYLFDDLGNRTELLTAELDRLRRQASYGADEKLVTIIGEVLHPGSYPLHADMRASDLLCAARGLGRKAYGLSAELSRVRTSVESDDRIEHNTLDSVELLRLCELSRQAARGELDKERAHAFALRYQDGQLNPVLSPLDQLVFTEKPGWVERATVTLNGELQRPGVYVIDRGESLCEVLSRAGGITEDAYVFGAYFTRRSVRDMQQQTLDELQAQLDDLMVELSLSHSYNNEEKSSHEWGGKQDYMKTIRQLERAEASGRMVINLERSMKCQGRNQLVLQDGDAITVPRRPDYVQVAGQVYVPTSHLFQKDRSIADYVELSGGHTVLGRLKDTYVIQANGEVLNFKGSRSSSRIARSTVMPGARIYVPLNIDRMNATETAQTWVSSLVQSAILAGIVL